MEKLEGSDGETVGGRTWWYSGYLVEPHVITEVGIMIEHIVSSIGGPPAINVAPKYVSNAVLDLLSNFDQIHILPASCRTFNLR